MSVLMAAVLFVPSIVKLSTYLILASRRAYGRNQEPLFGFLCFIPIPYNILIMAKEMVWVFNDTFGGVIYPLTPGNVWNGPVHASRGQAKPHLRVQRRRNRTLRSTNEPGGRYPTPSVADQPAEQQLIAHPIKTRGQRVFSQSKPSNPPRQTWQSCLRPPSQLKWPR